MIPGSLHLAKAANSAVATVAAKKDLEKLKSATDGLEAFMFKSLLQSMGGKKGFFSSKIPGAEIYRDMFETNMSDLLASRGTLHIGSSIYSKVAPMVISQSQQRIKQSSIEKKI